MTRVSLVVAVSRNGVIGRAGGLPWRIPSDLKRFKQVTMGKPMIMGRKTWESLPKKPLPGRRNIVVTRNPGLRADGAEVASSPEAALALCANEAEVSVIGGGEIYRQFWARADRLYLTEVDVEVDGDTSFPPIIANEWIEISRERHEAAPGDSAGYTLRILDRAVQLAHN